MSTVFFKHMTNNQDPFTSYDLTQKCLFSSKCNFCEGGNETRKWSATETWAASGTLPPHSVLEFLNNLLGLGTE
jgi:hypothetical protein